MILNLHSLLMLGRILKINLISSTRHFRQNSITTTLINVLLTHSAFSSFSLREKVSHFRWRKTRKTHHSSVFSFMNVLEWLRMFIELRDVYEDNLFLVFSSLKKTRRRHQPRWDEIAERRLLDLVAAPTFPTCRKGRKFKTDWIIRKSNQFTNRTT